ncbi:ead/Ea22-like family protein [Enterobacter asburiae]
MSNIDKRALREAAEKAGADEWRAFIDTKSKTYAVHTPGDNRCGDVVKWAGFDGQQKAANKARFIAAANPATVLALLDEVEAKDRRIEEEIGRANREHHRGFMMACGHLKEHSNVHYADAAEMEIAALRNRINELENAAAGKGE